MYAFYFCFSNVLPCCVTKCFRNNYSNNNIEKIITNLNNRVAAVKQSNGKLYGFLKDATRMVAHDEVNNEISCTLTVQVTLATLYNIKSPSRYTPFHVNAAYMQIALTMPAELVVLDALLVIGASSNIDF